MIRFGIPLAIFAILGAVLNPARAQTIGCSLSWGGMIQTPCPAGGGGGGPGDLFLEDGSSFLLLEDGVSKLCLESGC
jgi:hypothetical protein